MTARACHEPGDGPRRLIVFVVWDRRGDVERYVEHAIAGLREHAAHILVIVNGTLTPSGRERLERVADEIVVRDNHGFDIWGHKHALDHLGERIADFDELILTNDTWFGPVRPYGPVLARMDARSADFWGMTDHAREEPNPFTGDGVLPYHLQSFWIAVRRRMFLSEAWREYWANLPEMPGYFDAVLRHEVVFTEHFAAAGFHHDVAFRSTDYPTSHPALFNSDLLLRDGCPLLKRRQFFHYPPFLDRHAVIGRHTLREVEDYGYPLPLIWEDMSRNVAPRVANTNAAALEVLSDRRGVGASDAKPRPLTIVHVVHAEALDGVIDHARRLPERGELIVTVADGPDAEKIGKRLEAGASSGFSDSELRVVPRGVDHMGALLVACHDVLTDDARDIVVKLVASRPRRGFFNADRYAARYQLENLLDSPGYVANLLALFAQEPGLGAVFPPTTQIGAAHIGNGWGPMRAPAEALAAMLGIRVPFDEISPLAPFGGMMVFRTKALSLLAEHPWTYADYADEPGGRPQESLSGLQERLVASAMGERGYHCRTVLTTAHADISHTALEFTLDQISSTTPGYPVEQIQYLHRAGRMGDGGAWDLARMYLRLNHPDAARAIADAGRRVASRLRGGR